MDNTTVDSHNDPWNRTPEYTYPGQWFDDMGALALTFGDSPILGIDLVRAQMSRAQTNDLAVNLNKADVTPYDQPGLSNSGA